MEQPTARELAERAAITARILGRTISDVVQRGVSFGSMTQEQANRVHAAAKPEDYAVARGEAQS